MVRSHCLFVGLSEVSVSGGKCQEPPAWKSHIPESDKETSLTRAEKTLSAEARGPGVMVNVACLDPPIASLKLLMQV